ncbi:hypothetical protein [Halorientalis persicus]|nr:hypothetical protein [Halorientalis persicus]
MLLSQRKAHLDKTERKHLEDRLTAEGIRDREYSLVDSAAASPMQ